MVKSIRIDLTQVQMMHASFDLARLSVAPYCQSAPLESAWPKLRLSVLSSQSNGSFYRLSLLYTSNTATVVSSATSLHLSISVIRIGYEPNLAPPAATEEQTE